MSEIQDLLAAFDDVTAVDVFDGESGTPTLDDLRPYTSVIVADNDPFEHPAAVGDVLADYADAGGGVVLTLASFIDRWQLAGRFESEGYDPFNIGVGPYTPSTLDLRLEPSDHARDPHQGVPGLVSLAPGAARWPRGTTRCRSSPPGRTSAAVNVFVGLPGFWTGDVPLILHNAALWGSNASTWLSVSPLSGVVPVGGHADLAVDYDATSIPGGDYTASVVLRTNDPEALEGRVPVTLRVHSAPDARVARRDRWRSLHRHNDEAACRSDQFRDQRPAREQPGRERPDYSVDHPSFDLEAQGRLLVDVSFHPTRIGAIQP